MKKQFNFIDLFAGIGGIRIPFEELGGKCVFTSEWDKYSQITYEANFGEKPHGDITQIDLPSEKESGLKHVLEVIKHLKNVGVINFNHKDVIRHQIVQDIVEAYQKHKN